MAAALKEQLHTGRCLTDCLIAAKVLSEETFLDFLVRESGTEALLGRKFARVIISPWVLDRLPAQVAGELSVLPLAFDDRTQKLTLALADPADTEVIARVMAVARPGSVRRVAVLEGSIRAGIRKFYFGEADAFTAEGQPKRQHYRCTNCRTWLSGAVVWCSGCFLLLDPTAPEASAETSVIRMLLGEPLQALGARPGSSSDSTTASRPFVPLAGIVAPASEARLLEDSLAPFEAFVVSRANGKRTIVDIARACGMAEVETQAVATALVGRGVLAVLTQEELESSRSAVPPSPARASPETGTAKREQWDLLEEAVRHEQAGDFDTAIRILTKGIERMTHAPRLYNRLAAVLMRRSDHFGSLHLLERAAALDPENRVISHNLSQLKELVGLK